MNEISEWLGLPDEREIEHNESEKKRIAGAISTLVNHPEWVVFMEELDRFEATLDRPCEVYANQPNLAWHDIGAKYTVKVIHNFIQRQVQLIEQYAKTQQGKEEGVR